MASGLDATLAQTGAYCRDRLEGIALSAAPATKEDQEVITLFFGTVGGDLGCTQCLKVRWVLEYLGLPYRLGCIDLYDNKPEWYTELSPAGTTPSAWVRGDYCPESGDVIAAALAVAAADETSAGAGGRAFAARSAGSEIEPLETGLTGGVFGVLLSDPETDGEHETKCDKLRADLGAIDAVLRASGPFMCGERPGPADAAAILHSVLLLAAEQLVPSLSLSSSYPSLAWWMESIRKDEVYRRATAGHITLPEALNTV